MPLKDIQLANISPSNRALGLFTVDAYSDDCHRYVTFEVTGEPNAVKLRNAIREYADRLTHVFDNTREAKAKAVPAPSLMRHMAKLDLIGFGSVTRGDDESDAMAAIDELVSQRAQIHCQLAGLGYTINENSSAAMLAADRSKWWFSWSDLSRVETGANQNTQTEAMHDAVMHALARLENMKIEPKETALQERPEWREEYNAAAELEGWAVFNDNEIQRDDEMDVFAGDWEAVAHVKRLAEAGSAMHLAALCLHIDNGGEA